MSKNICTNATINEAVPSALPLHANESAAKRAVVEVPILAPF